MGNAKFEWKQNKKKKMFVADVDFSKSGRPFFIRFLFRIWYALVSIFNPKEINLHINGYHWYFKKVKVKKIEMRVYY